MVVYNGLTNFQTMEIKTLITPTNVSENNKLHQIHLQFNRLLVELRKEKLTDEIVVAINSEIDNLNNTSDTEKALFIQIKKSQTKTLKLIEKELNLVTINHNRNLWLAIGIAAFGMPLGIVFGTTLGNMGFIALGIPIGMVLGLAVGTHLDKKAVEEGRQIDFEAKF